MTKKLHLVSENDSPVNPTEQQRTDISQETKNNDTKPWVVKVSDISKSFSIYTSDRARVLEFRNRQHHSKHWALQNCNFDIKKENASVLWEQMEQESQQCSNSSLG